MLFFTVLYIRLQHLSSHLVFFMVHGLVVRLVAFPSCVEASTVEPMDTSPGFPPTAGWKSRLADQRSVTHLYMGLWHKKILV
jgi:hypothetical protein